MKPDPTVDHSGSLGEVREQGEHHTCLSQAASTVNRTIKNVSEPLSAETLHFHAIGPNWSTGISISQVQQALEGEGQPKEKFCEPVQDQTAGEWTPPSDAPMYLATSDKETVSLSYIEDALRDSILPILGVTTTKDFYYPKSPWVISADQPMNRHAIVAVGLADYGGETLVKIRNSWGDDWADSGHAWLDQSFINNNLKEVLVLLEGEVHD